MLAVSSSTTTAASVVLPSHVLQDGLGSSFLEVCLTVDGVDALCAVGSALSGLWKVLYYVWVELNIMANTWQQVDTHSSRISRLTFTDHLTS
jgi:hypothetical protein